MAERHLSMTPQHILGAHYRMPGLSDIERILVVSDGTFTYQLETFVREPIGVEIYRTRWYRCRRAMLSCWTAAKANWHGTVGHCCAARKPARPCICAAETATATPIQCQIGRKITLGL